MNGYSNLMQSSVKCIGPGNPKYAYPMKEEGVLEVLEYLTVLEEPVLEKDLDI